MMKAMMAMVVMLMIVVIKRPTKINVEGQP